MFAISRWSNREHTGITFKVSEIAFEVLRNEPSLRPAPYFASRGMKWIQHYAEPGLSDEGLKSYLSQSHHIVYSGLTKQLQKELMEVFKVKMTSAQIAKAQVLASEMWEKINN